MTPAERLYRIVLVLGSEWFWNGEWRMEYVRALTDSLPSPPVVPTVENPLAWLESSHTWNHSNLLFNLMMHKLARSAIYFMESKIIIMIIIIIIIISKAQNNEV